jgi:hypothetical protein
MQFNTCEICSELKYGCIISPDTNQKVCLSCSVILRRHYRQFDVHNFTDKKFRSIHSSVHRWLKDNFGKAYRCENPQCSGRGYKFYWAKLRNKKYEKKKENFTQLCNNCHSLYDRARWDMKLKPTTEPLKFGAFRLSKASQEQLLSLCSLFGENISRTILRLITEEYTRRFDNKNEL